MRSALTALGIIIGVSAVIAMMEIGNGTSSQISKSITTMGVDNLLVAPGSAASGGVTFGAGQRDHADAGRLGRDPARVPGRPATAPVVRARTQVIYGNRNWVPTFINGTTASFLEVRNWSNLAEGEPFTDQTCAMRARSACSARRWFANCSWANHRSGRRSGSRTWPSR